MITLKICRAIDGGDSEYHKIGREEGCRQIYASRPIHYLAVGKASDFESPLIPGEVAEIDITIPSPSPEPVPEAGEGDVAKAREILAAAIDAHGGWRISSR